MKTVLLIGASGSIGTYFYTRLSQEKNYRVIGTYCHHQTNPDYVQLDLTNQQSLKNVLIEQNPHIIFLLAGKKDVSWCEQNQSQAIQDNVATVLNLIQATLAFPATKLYYLSSDYVFSGNKQWFSEDNQPQPDTTYGKTKLAAERLISLLSPSNCVIRTSAVISPQSTLINWFKRTVENQETVLAYSHAFFTPTPVSYLYRKMIELWESPTVKLPPLIHISGNHGYSKYEFLNLLNELLYQKKATIEPDQNTNTALSNHGVLLRDTYAELKTTQQFLRELTLSLS